MGPYSQISDVVLVDVPVHKGHLDVLDSLDHEDRVGLSDMAADVASGKDTGTGTEKGN